MGTQQSTLPSCSQGMEEETLTSQRAPPVRRHGMEKRGGTPHTVAHASRTHPGDRGGQTSESGGSSIAKPGDRGGEGNYLSSNYNMKREYSEMCGFVRARMSLAIVRSNSLLLHDP